ncbi:TauD/TfdA family dioxygenase [Streptomyces sp. W007]|uniref:TauD/TfdA family dioxygenase n=1 Tax=Streptomyces sp. W007 TaxID=1055352 RepID=UPI0002E1879C
MVVTSQTTQAEPFEVAKTDGRPAVLTFGGRTPADPVAWATENRDVLRGAVAEHGALLVRGLDLRDAQSVGRVSRELLDRVMTEREGFATREVWADGVYSSSEWPADQPMCMHHELSYARQVPATLLFACLTAPDSGGATGVADSHEVLEALPPAWWTGSSGRAGCSNATTPTRSASAWPSPSVTAAGPGSRRTARPAASS